ncbi:MAG: DMT family transporter [Solobacterium sp.]|nr:DMT family transporter [Solobacterium sp.]
MHEGKNDPRSLVMLISALLIFGSIGIIRRFIPLSSAFLAFARGTLGGLFILAFMKVTGRRILGGMNAGQFLWLACTGAVMGCNWILLFEAYEHTTIAVATLCYYMQPTIVMLVSPFLFKEKLTKKKAVCAAAALIGMMLVSGVFEGGGAQSRDMRGILFGLSAAVLYAGVVIMNKKIRGIDVYRKTAVQLLSAGLVMVPYLVLGKGFPAAVPDLPVILLLLTAGIFHTGIAYVLYFGSMDGLKAQSIAIYSYIDPVSALLFSAVLLRETISISCLAGAVLIIGSALVCELPAEKST